MSEEIPKAPPSGKLGQPGARAYDDQGRVRPADGRFLGDASDDVPPQDLQAIREEEIRRGNERLAEQRRREEAENQRRLDESGYVNPTIPPAVEPSGVDQADDGPDGDPDRYTDMEYADLQKEAKSRDGMSAGGSADELRARLRADDEAKA
jgi:hypothetical protein